MSKGSHFTLTPDANTRLTELPSLSSCNLLTHPLIALLSAAIYREIESMADELVVVSRRLHEFYASHSLLHILNGKVSAVVVVVEQNSKMQ